MHLFAADDWPLLHVVLAETSSLGLRYRIERRVELALALAGRRTVGRATAPWFLEMHEVTLFFARRRPAGLLRLDVEREIVPQLAALFESGRYEA